MGAKLQGGPALAATSSWRPHQPSLADKQSLGTLLAASNVVDRGPRTDPRKVTVCLCSVTVSNLIGKWRSKTAIL